LPRNVKRMLDISRTLSESLVRLDIYSLCKWG
jgi:hypothetical protein